MTTQSESEPNQEQGKMPLIEHLAELRIRVIRCFIALFVCVIGAYFFRKEILDLIRKPVDDPLKRYTIVELKEEEQKEPLEKLNDSYDCSCSPVLSTSASTGNASSASTGNVSSASTRNASTDSSADLSSTGFSTSQVSASDQPSDLDLLAKRENLFPQQLGIQKEIQMNCVCSLKNAPEALEKKTETAGLSSMVFIGLPELFFSQMKVSFFTGLFLSFPFLLTQIWSFIGPALYTGEKKIFWIFGITSYISFIGGGLFGYFYVFPYGLDFFLSLTQPGEIVPSLSIGDYLSFTLKLLFAFGVIFELPLVVFILARMGLITPEMMLKHFKYVILGICVLAAVLTPPDPFTMMLMAGPLGLLYFLSIGVAYLAVNRKKAAQRAEGFEEEEYDEDYDYKD